MTFSTEYLLQYYIMVGWICTWGRNLGYWGSSVKFVLDFLIVWRVGSLKSPHPPSCSRVNCIYLSKVKVAPSYLILRPHGLLQGILQARILEWVAVPFFPTLRLNPGLLHCRRILYLLNYQGSPYIFLLGYISETVIYISLGSKLLFGIASCQQGYIELIMSNHILSLENPAVFTVLCEEISQDWSYFFIKNKTPGEEKWQITGGWYFTFKSVIFTTSF